ncbi:MAG: hypothetical protein ACR2F0_04400 [Chthoniobacterales bacterium]
MSGFVRLLLARRRFFCFRVADSPCQSRLGVINHTDEMVQIVITGVSQDEINEWCVTRLRARGYAVDRSGKWETPRELCERLGISKSKLRRRWGRYPRPQTRDVQTGPSGRLVMLRSNSILDAFLQRR